MFKPSFFSRERRGCVENVGFVNSGQISDDTPDSDLGGLTTPASVDTTVGQAA
jgi:hypothetical protein